MSESVTVTALHAPSHLQDDHRVTLAAQSMQHTVDRTIDAMV